MVKNLHKLQCWLLGTGITDISYGNVKEKENHQFF